MKSNNHKNKTGNWDTKAGIKIGKQESVKKNQFGNQEMKI